jgi:hypothetical protein
MKIYLALGFVFMLFFAYSCGNKVDTTLEGKTYKTEGWIDDDTFRVSAVGSWPERAKDKNPIVKRNLACEAALVIAQKVVVEKLVGASVEGTSGVVDGESAGLAIKKKFGGYIRGGSVVQKTITKEYYCEVVYEIKAKNLKQRVKELVEKYIKNLK